MKSWIFSVYVALMACMLSPIANASIFQLPEQDIDGTFDISWSYESGWLKCRKQRLYIDSQNGYNEIIALSDSARSHSFHDLPAGMYNISMHATCQHNIKNPQKIDGMIESRKISIGSSIFEKSVSANTQLISELSAANTSATTGCSVNSCTLGSHSTQKGCVANCASFSSCANGILSFNWISCASNTSEFWTCDSFCGTDHRQTDIQNSNSLDCAVGTQLPNGGRPKIKCALKEPAQPTITSGTSSPLGTYTLAWNSSSRATRYEWRKGTDGWSNVGTNRTAYITNLPIGNTQFEVRACNTTGCSSAANKTVVVGPSTPALQLPTTNTSGNYELSWNPVTNAGYYEWRENAGNWNSSTSTRVTFSNKPVGTYTYYVRACVTNLGCGSSSNASIQVQNPTITIGSYGNATPSMRHTATCLSTSETCTVSGNTTLHYGPRTCSIRCPLNQVVSFRCETNLSGRAIDEYLLPPGSVQVADPICNSTQCMLYQWRVTGSPSQVNCMVTD